MYKVACTAFKALQLVFVEYQYNAQNWTNRMFYSSRIWPQCKEHKSHIFWQFKHSHPTLHLIITSKARAKSICTNSLTTNLTILLHSIISMQMGKNTNLTPSLCTPSWTYIGLICADLSVLLFFFFPLYCIAKTRKEKGNSTNKKAIHVPWKKAGIRTKKNLQNSATGFMHVIFVCLEIIH